MKNKNITLVDTETGEIMDISEYSIRKKDDIERQKEGLKKRIEMYNNRFYWGNMKNIKYLLEQNEIKLSTLGAILVLSCYINADNTLICKADKGKTPFTTKEIMNDILRMSQPTFKRFISDCKKLNILCVEGQGKSAKYRLNNDLHFVGRQDNKQASKETVRIYRKGILSMISSNLSLDNIGFIYLIIPYINYENCTLVDNPFSENEIPLTYENLGKLLGISRATLSKYLNMTFKYDFSKERQSYIYRLNVFGNFRGGKGTAGKYVFCVNPLILRRCLNLKGTINYQQLEKMFTEVGERVNDKKDV